MMMEWCWVVEAGPAMADEALVGGCRREARCLQAELVPEALSGVQHPNETLTLSPRFGLERRGMQRGLSRVAP